MPDFFNTRAVDDAPRGWSEAFAALPTETPPGDGWTRISRALDAPASKRDALLRERRTSWLVGLASAAVIVLAAWSPLSRWLQSDPTESQPPAVAAAAPGLRGPAAPLRDPSEPERVATAVESATSNGHEAAVRNASTAAATHRKPARPRAVAKRTRIEPTTVAAPTRDAAPTETETETDPASVATTGPDVDPLQKLQTQSAQLEALVSLARDDRVANASELLSSELDAGIAAVDAALSQTDVTDARKQALWQQRVDLLRQLAGIEATSRWLAAQGASSETMLVSVD